MFNKDMIRLEDVKRLELIDLKVDINDFNDKMYILIERFKFNRSEVFDRLYKFYKGEEK